MAGRKSNILKSRNDDVPKPKQQRKRGKGLNALAIAEHEFPTKTKIRAHRFGEVDDFPKRRRNDEEDVEPDTKRRKTDEDAASEADYGSDSEGHEWKVGQVDSEDDSDIDSDEALGESDEERFEDFTFRGSSSKTNSKLEPKSKIVRRHKIDLSEGSGSDVDSGQEDDGDDLGEDAVDLATAWDMNGEDDESDEQAASKISRKSEKSQPVNELSDGSGSDSGSYGSSDEEESEDTDISVSDDEMDEKQDGLSKLQDFVSSLGTNNANSISQQRKAKGQENGAPTEYGLTSTRKLNVSDLLSSVTDSRLKGSLKHLSSTPTAQGAKSSAAGKLTAPLAKRQQDKIDRAAAYEKSKETLNRWIDTVKANREAEHISFPLPDPYEQQVARLGPVDPKTDLESTIKSILVESGLATDEKTAEKQFQAAEELETRKMSLEEVRARNLELRKRRDLLFREEVRAKRIKKIKSKSYRRVHRKEREKLEEAERQALIDAGIDPDEQDRELYDRRRAEARMNTKHRDSKWAKSMKETGRTAWDEDARSSMHDMARRDEELQRRIEGRSVKTDGDDYLGSSSSGSEDDHDEWDEDAGSDAEVRILNKDLDALHGLDDSESTGPHSKLMSMSFMQKAEAGRKQQNDEEIRRLRREINGDEDHSEEEEGGRKKFGVSQPAEKQTLAGSRSKNEFEETVASEDEDLGNETTEATAYDPSSYAKGRSKSKGNAVSRSAKASEYRPAMDESDKEIENPWLVQNTRTNRKRQVNDNDDNINISIGDQEPAEVSNVSKALGGQKPRKASIPKSHINTQNNELASDSGDEDAPVLLTNHELVKRAFAGDDVVADFEREKQETIEEEGDKVVDNTLPGWGSWTGAGISKKQQKRQKKFLTKVEGIKPEQRKDARLGHVIINEKRMKKVGYIPSGPGCCQFKLIIIFV